MRDVKAYLRISHIAVKYNRKVTITIYIFHVLNSLQRAYSCAVSVHHSKKSWRQKFIYSFIQNKDLIYNSRCGIRPKEYKKKWNTGPDFVDLRVLQNSCPHLKMRSRDSKMVIYILKHVASEKQSLNLDPGLGC